MAQSTLPGKQERAFPIPSYLKVLRIFFASCIALGPLSHLLYAVFGPNGKDGSAIIAANLAQNVTLNQLHLLFGVIASFLLPFGFLGMAVLAMKRTPWFGTICIMLSLPGWTPLSALIGLDALALDMAQLGGGTQFVALYNRFSTDGVMLSYLVIYAISHLLSSVLLGIALGKGHVIPLWAAVALVLLVPLTILAFPAPGIFHILVLFLVLVLEVVGSFPAALAMLKSSDIQIEGGKTEL